MKRLDADLLEEARELPAGPTSTEPEPTGDVCPKCGGCGFVRRDVPLDHPDFGLAFVCGCRRGAAVETDGIPPLFAECSFGNFDLSLNRKMGDAFRACREMLEGQRKLALLYGGTGLGKTHLAVATLRDWRAAGKAGRFWTVPDLLSELRGCYDEGATATIDQRVEQLVSPGYLLVLDDLGAQRQTEWVEEQLYRVLDGRYGNKAPTVITSNAAIEAIDARIRSRFRSALVLCEGKDLR